MGQCDLFERSTVSDYVQHLRRLRTLPSSELEAQVQSLIDRTPENVWPGGFPASLDPKLVVIGVSYGNSPHAASEQQRSEGQDYFVSRPGVQVGDDSHFYYPDSRAYWKKIRHLSMAYFSSRQPEMSQVDALSLTTHINLGTGVAGSASKHDVEKNYVQWASRLLAQTHKPDLVVLVGLKRILKDPEVAAWWNHAEGLPVNWRKPEHAFKFQACGRNYSYESWEVSNGLGHTVQVVLWPNHPSRAPFSAFSEWKRSVDGFLQHSLSSTKC